MKDKRIPLSLIRQLWLDPDITSAQAAARVGLTRAALQRRARLMGLPPKRPGGRYKIDWVDADFAALWASRLTAAEIASRLGVALVTVYAARRRMGLPSRRSGTHDTVQLDDPDFADMWRDGVAASDMAAHYGIGTMAISQTARRRGLPARKPGWGAAVRIGLWRMRQAAAMESRALQRRCAA